MTIELHNNVYCEGEGIPVVLVHGFPVDHRMWNECADALKTTAAEHGMKQFPIWAPDMPGAGEGPIPSDENSGGKDTDGAFLNGLDRMADAYVDLLHAAGYDTKAAADSEKMRAKRIAIAEECESTGTHEPVMGFAAATSEDSTIKQSDAYREQFTAWINEQPAEGIAWRERMAAGRPDLSDVLSTITAPVAVICGDKDPSSPPSVMAPIADAMTAASTDMTVVFDCGHFSAYEHPQAVADALLALVRRVQ